MPDEPTPKSGTAQVVAQGVVALPDSELRWQISESVAPSPANASPANSDPGFLIAQSGVVLIEDVETGDQHRLPAGESALTRGGVEQIRVALGSDTAAYRELSVVDAAAEPDTGTVLFSSEPFAGPGARHDLDLLHDALAPGATFSVPGGALPTLAVILDGRAEVTTEAGDVISLGAGEALSLEGPLVITAAENGADVVAVYTGPAVPPLTQGAATPAAGVRVIESAEDVEATASASPVVATATAEPSEDEPSAAASTDADEDGLNVDQEAELNTDPALADTDEDGLTDGQEALEIGTAPLAPDTDDDGILDGDEIAQGTDPLDGVAGSLLEADGAVAAEPSPAEVIPAPEGEPAAEAPGTIGDGDGDGLEDAIELELGTDPFDADTDDDGATDGNEYYVLQSGTRNPDSDGDGVLDGTEATNGTDPNDANSF
ncbi:MAG: hypothetical protein H0T18_04185 [Chloroflexia bacterium]|nr:hypothetical protein [Chloroflexia bacterium]